MPANAGFVHFLSIFLGQCDAHNLRSLIDLFSKDVFRDGHGEDVIGRVYEYFIGEFASSEGKRGGEFFTPLTIVRTLVALGGKYSTGPVAEPARDSELISACLIVLAHCLTVNDELRGAFVEAA